MLKIMVCVTIVNINQIKLLMGKKLFNDINC
jgi:hypothetical protein